MPIGFQEMIAPAYLSKVYASGRTGENYADSWVALKGLQRCHLAQDMKSAFTSCDILLLVDNLGSGYSAPINCIMLELLARTSYSRERGFEAVCKEDDWKRPRQAQKDWKSKVKYNDIRLWDSRYESPDTFKMPSAEIEVRNEVEREAMIAKSQAKLEKNVPASQDILNQ